MLDVILRNMQTPRGESQLVAIVKLKNGCVMHTSIILNGQRGLIFYDNTRCWVHLAGQILHDIF